MVKNEEQDPKTLLGADAEVAVHKQDDINKPCSSGPEL
jgi:hypothetical protein